MSVTSLPRHRVTADLHSSRTIVRGPRRVVPVRPGGRPVQPATPGQALRMRSAAGVESCAAVDLRPASSPSERRLAAMIGAFALLFLVAMVVVCVQFFSVSNEAPDAGSSVVGVSQAR